MEVPQITVIYKIDDNNNKRIIEQKNKRMWQITLYWTMNDTSSFGTI